MNRPVLLTLAFVSMLALQTSAQYFGRNKVQYETFDFKVLQSDNLRVHYYPLEEEAARDATRMLERWNSRFSKLFERSLPDNQPIILYSNHADFQQTNAIENEISQSTGGVTEGLMNRVVVPLTGIYSEDNHVLGHELVHAYHYQILRSSEGGLYGAAEIPLWFIEGMSEYLSLGSEHALTAMWMRDAVLHGDTPSFMDVGSSYRYFPYRFGHSIWAYMTGQYGDRAVLTLFNGVLRHGWYAGYRRILGSTVDSVSTRYNRMIKDHFGPTLDGRSLPAETGHEIIGEGEMNLAPSISPDGSRIAFMSTRDIFSIDLFLADARSGKIIRKLVSSQGNDHFDALRFINSSGAWSPDGSKLAFVVFREGRNEIGIVNSSRGDMEMLIHLDSVSEITGLSWSPDGKYLAVAGSYGGVGDLFLYDFTNQSVRKLTRGRYAEIQPAWSHDGSSIAFVTDRGPETNIDSLQFGPMQIGIYDMSTGSIRLLSIAPWAKHINPQYSPDGKSLFMVADPDGVSDIYRYSFEDGQFYRVSKIATGISGLSELSPAMSLASSSGEMAFSVFNRGMYLIRGFVQSELEGTPFTADSTVYNRVVSLRPAPSPDVTMSVDKYLQNPVSGLPDTTEFSVNDYHPKLRLLYVGELFAGVAASRSGVGVGGGASFLFSDLLGDHIMGLSAQINGSLKDVGAQGLYVNRKHRLNWGLSLERVPYYSSGIQLRTEGESEIYTLIDKRIFENSVTGFLEYPLTTNRRFEFSAGFTRYSYDYYSEDIRVDSGRITDRNESTVNEPPSLNLFRGSMAYVGDFSFFGFTAPVSGRRYRFELEPTAGSLYYVSALADYRQYLFLNPVTLAARLMHYGRYLGDSQSDQISPLFLGYETFVRGYSAITYNLSGCSDDDNYSGCPEFNRLLGSRIGIMNLELRLPLLGTEQFGLINFPYLPTDLVAFFDGGVAWSAGDLPELKWDTHNTTDRIPVFSAGGGARINFFGLLVMQFYYAYPFQRPDFGWHWGFFLAPGW